MWNGESFNSIAKTLKRPTSTVSREVWRTVKKKLSSYHAEEAHASAAKRARRGRPNKLAKNSSLKEYVEAHLKIQWSPEEIAKRLRLEYPHDMTMRISHETIYNYLYCLPKLDFGQFR